MREKRESLLQAVNANEELEDTEKKDDEEKELNVSLDLDDLEDLENETFGSNPKKDEATSNSKTPEKEGSSIVDAFSGSGPKPAEPLSIIDFLTEKVSPDKSHGPPPGGQAINLAGLGILGDAIAKSQPTLPPVVVKESTTGWDDEDMIGDDLDDELDPQGLGEDQAKEAQIPDKMDTNHVSKPADTDGGWAEDDIDL